MNSCDSCCRQCDPCCSMPYGQSSESCFGAEVEAIPQIIPEQQFSCCESPPVSKKKKVKKNKVEPLRVNSRKVTNIKLPRAQIIRRIKAGVLYSTWDCCKRNGIQDETPQWLVLGRPYRRPGPGYRCVDAYFPSNNCQCNY